MRIKTIFFILIIISLSSFFVFNCAGTKKGTEGENNKISKNEEKQKENLDDIEALLGITSDKSETPETQKKSANGEKLNLLKSDEVAAKQSNSSLQAAAARQQDQSNELGKYKGKVNKLENQLEQKNKKIAELNALIDEQDAEIQKIQKSGKNLTLTALGGQVSGEEYKARYKEGLAAFEARRYRDAIEYFQSLLASSTANSLADNAQYWIGECHYALHQYDAAIIDFEKVLTFPRSNKKADAQFKLGLCYVKKGDKEKATEEFQRLLSDFPNSRNVKRAQRYLANF